MSSTKASDTTGMRKQEMGVMGATNILREEEGGGDETQPAHSAHVSGHAYIVMH